MKALARNAAPEVKLKDISRKSTPEAKAMSRKRNATDDAMRKAKIRKYAKTGGPGDIAEGVVLVGDDAQVADGAEINPGRARAVYGVGRGAADGPAAAVPDNYKWMPTRNGDLSGDGKVAEVSAMRDFLDGLAPGTCENFRSR